MHRQALRKYQIPTNSVQNNNQIYAPDIHDIKIIQNTKAGPGPRGPGLGLGLGRVGLGIL